MATFYRTLNRTRPAYDANNIFIPKYFIGYSKQQETIYDIVPNPRCKAFPNYDNHNYVIFIYFFSILEVYNIGFFWVVFFGQVNLRQAFGGNLTALEEKDRHLPEVEVDEVASLVRHIAAKVAPDNAMPSRVVFLVKFFFDVSCYVLLDVVFFEGLRPTVDSILLHLLGHVSIFNNRLPISHLASTDSRWKKRIKKGQKKGGLFCLLKAAGENTLQKNKRIFENLAELTMGIFFKFTKYKNE